MTQQKSKKIIKVRDLMPTKDVKGGGHRHQRHNSLLNQNIDRDFVPRGGYGIHLPQ